jgi:hypothetical protein
MTEPARTVVQAEALAWLAANAATPGTHVVTSMPDVSEFLSETPNASSRFEAWRAWFGDAAEALLRWTPPDASAVFFQSDVRHAGAWVDKAYLVQRAAERTGHVLAWHKIVCRSAPDTLHDGRAQYAHLLAFARPERLAAGSTALGFEAPDVLADGGRKSFTRAMGERAAWLAGRYVAAWPRATCVVDPFCGQGIVLAVANALGLDAIGVDWDTARCRVARKARVSQAWP